MRKLKALLGTVLLGAAMAVAVGSPAQAWSYCSTTGRSVNGAVNFYEFQGYCGPWSYDTPQFGVCVDLSNNWANNWIAAVWNRTTADITLFERPDCDYINGPYMILNNGNSDPDLWNNGLYKNTTSYRWTL
jgi:hypothetical protein